MPRILRHAALALGAALALPVAAQMVGGGGDPNAGSRVPPPSANGAAIHRVYVHVVNPTADEAQDRALRDLAAQAFRMVPGESFHELVADRGILRVRALPGIAAAEYRVYRVAETGLLWVAVLVRRDIPGAPPSAPPPFWSGDVGRHLRIVEAPGAMVKLLFNGALGAFLDDGAWFGEPGAFRAAAYEPSDPVAWPEVYFEPGIGGVARLWGTDAYLYGAVSYLVSSRMAADVFQPDSTWYGKFEKGYAGVVVGREGSSRVFDLSAGRRDFELPGELLVSPIPGSVNAAERGASYLGARKAYRNVVQGKLVDGSWSIQGLYLYPDRLPQADDRSQYAGAVLRYDDHANLEVAATWLAVVASEAQVQLPGDVRKRRVGLHAVSPRLVLTGPLGLEGVALAGEYVYQWNANFPMSSFAWYAQGSYRFDRVPWTPSLMVRYAAFSGDDPGTSSYGRYDPLLSGKQDYWMQGMNFVKAWQNANLRSWRASLRGKPTPASQLILDYYWFRADSLNNLGSAVAPAQQLAGRDLGQELMATASWYATPNLYTSFVFSWTRPLGGLEAALGPGAEPWLTFQLAAYWFF